MNGWGVKHFWKMGWGSRACLVRTNFERLKIRDGWCIGRKIAKKGGKRRKSGISGFLPWATYSIETHVVEPTSPHGGSNLQVENRGEIHPGVLKSSPRGITIISARVDLAVGGGYYVGFPGSIRAKRLEATCDGK